MSSLVMARYALVLAVVAAMLVVFTPTGAQAADRDCGDFANQRAAQIFFLKAGGPSRDPHRLDAEGDGIACESLPCPCYTTKHLPDGGKGDGAGSGGKQVRQYARIVRVVDGDTVDVRLTGGARKRIRMIGIDTPEVYGGTECGGPQASSSLKSMLPRSTRVRLLSDPTQANKDRYGRLLRYVHKNGSGQDVNRAQVYRGWARVYVYNNDPFSRVGSYRAAQAAAKDADRGIWGRC